MPPRLTPLRLTLLRLTAQLTRETGGPPSAAELARAASLTEATISFHLKALVELGMIERTGARGRLILTEQARNAIQDGIPIYGQIAAGAPILAEQTPDRVTPSLDQLLGVKEGDFLLQVRGDSMTGIGVMDGDYVLVRPTPEVLDGDVAVVLIPGDNAATLKRVYVFGDEVVLISENPDHPRRTYPAADVQIQGRMVARLGLAGPRPLTRRT
ncbi:transcriptional repressor LexA [Deinococcus soli (ex Cha et al. 2016)]|uniref:transcriptional repressor LexA n=1 Tax=Deinococcus soli (ex Cha et al. 2016) TaxID=1309411 RepID=UPI00166ABA53|nr:transcriptional repressor LexA [Deinococcus soli (ex Cha et al. 2016)]GGB76663.1 lexA repressor [Deinococcus soli (ex Cha et al. 2016)]